MVRDLRENALKAYEAIFNGQRSIKVDGRVIQIGYISVQCLRKFSIDEYNYIEQNPDKGNSEKRYEYAEGTHTEDPRGNRGHDYASQKQVPHVDAGPALGDVGFIQ